MSDIKDKIALSHPETQARMLMEAGCNPPCISQNTPTSIIFEKTSSHVDSKD
jgi:hypothetical protein